MTTLEALAERVAHGEVLQDDDAAVVAGTYDLITVGMMADDVRRQLHGRETTFVRVLEMHVDAVPASVPADISAGEFRIIGAPASAEAACRAVAAGRRLAGAAPLTAFSLAALRPLAEASPDLFRRLQAAGLDAIAEAPLDAPSAHQDVERARAAGLRVLRLTVHAVPDDPLALVRRARALQRGIGGFRAFAPLPRSVPAAAPTTGYDDVKLIALARLMIRDIASIQVDWPLYGPKLAQVGLTVGADDVDGVAPGPGGLGPRRSPVEEVTLNIRAAGLVAVERDGLFTRPRGGTAGSGG